MNHNQKFYAYYSYIYYFVPNCLVKTVLYYLLYWSLCDKFSNDTISNGIILL